MDNEFKELACFGCVYKNDCANDAEELGIDDPFDINKQPCNRSYDIAVDFWNRVFGAK